VKPTPQQLDAEALRLVAWLRDIHIALRKHIEGLRADAKPGSKRHARLTEALKSLLPEET
jgi:hypothetical protein